MQMFSSSISPRTKLFFPEKRQFFLENAGVFDFRLASAVTLISYSSAVRLGSIPSRAAGSDQRWGQGHRFARRIRVGSPGCRYQIFRTQPRGKLRRVAFEEVVVGERVVRWSDGNRQAIRDAIPSFNQTAGVDGRFVLFKESRSKRLRCSDPHPRLSTGQTNLGAGLNFRSNWLDFEAEHRKSVPNFNHKSVFLERTDCVCDFADATFKARPNSQASGKCSLRGFIFHAPDTHGVVQTQEWQTTFRADFHNALNTERRHR